MLTGGFRTSEAIDDTLDAGAVDVVGLARPLVADPTFARGVLARPDAGIGLPARRVGGRRLDALAEVAWYTRQLRRLADGRDADLDARAGTALAAYLATTVGQAVTGARR